MQCRKVISFLVAEVHFEQPNAADTARVQKFPVLNQRWFFLNWQLPLQSPQHTAEGVRVLFLCRVISWEMNIDASARWLSIDLVSRASFRRCLPECD